MLKKFASCLFIYLLHQTYCTTENISYLSSQVFTVRNPNSFLRIESNWSFPLSKGLKFKFRTKQPSGLIMYHGMNDSTGSLVYALYLILENAKLRVIHKTDTFSADSFHVGKGLNHDKWHEVSLVAILSTLNLRIDVDSTYVNAQLPSLEKYSRFHNEMNISSYFYFGGFDVMPSSSQLYNYEKFIGCIGNIEFYKTNLNLSRPSVKFSSIENGCIDLCLTGNICENNGNCLNHYTRISCNCFGSQYEGNICEQRGLTAITLFGYSRLTYRIYDWSSRIHSEINKLGISFKAYFPNSLLFYASGNEPHHNYFSAVILNDGLYFEMSLGDEMLNATMSNIVLGKWHNFTMIHHGKEITLILDSTSVTLYNSGPHYHLNIDPYLFIGGISANSKGPKFGYNFVGCLKGVYFNDKDILFSLRSNDGVVRHHSLFPMKFGCQHVAFIPMTFPFVESQILINSSSNSIHQVSFEFKTTEKNGIIFTANIKLNSSAGLWQVRIHNSIIELNVQFGSRPVLQVIGNEILNDNQWHQISVSLEKNVMKLKVNQNRITTHQYLSEVELYEPFTFGSNSQDHTGFVGCIRNVHINKRHLDSRMLLNSTTTSRKVYLDNCQLVNPCRNPNVCEHGGACFVADGKISCNCSNTGYTGKTCHFSINRRSCEELYLLGYRKSGVYTIDIDKNGPFPPSNVKCIMDDDKNIITEIENNVMTEMIARKSSMEDFYVDITYRDFTSEMLQHFVSKSKICSQKIRYECYKVPFGLMSLTWLQSAKGSLVKKINSVPRQCICDNDKNCNKNMFPCNCDVKSDRWYNDKGEITNSEDIPITRIYVIQPKDFPHDGEAHLRLSALQCIETDTQLYVITFITENSYLQLPGWKEGDLAFSFRTSSNRAILLYQKSPFINHSYFQVLLIDDKTLSFEFTVNKKPYSIKVSSHNALNNGEWQQVWVDYDIHHIRFTVNLMSKMVDLSEEEDIGPFEGALYVGGLPKYQKIDVAIHQGFIGCFRGLVMNNDVINLYRYLNLETFEIEQGCLNSCFSNPCKNGATCHELWGSFRCECVNEIAYSGKFCENNINENSVTFLNNNSFYHLMGENKYRHPILNENIILNFFTFEDDALLLYAFDHLNNFVQLHWENGKRVVFTFNSLQTIVQVYVDVSVIYKGKPIQISVERNANMTTLNVNGKKAIVSSPIKFLQHYHQHPWIENINLEKVKPIRGTFSTIPHYEIFIGGVNEGIISHIPGLIGCLQGMKIGDELYDLKGQLFNLSQGNVKEECQTICHKSSCLHNGVCIELWNENKTKCDCLLTTYVGNICEKDIGGRFDGKSFMKYDFDMINSSLNTMSIKLAFSISEYRSATKQLILFIQFSESENYIMVTILPRGSLSIEERLNASVSKIHITKNTSFVDNFRHWIYYQRNNGIVDLVVDGDVYPVNRHIVTSSLLRHHYNYSSVLIGSLYPFDSKISDVEISNFSGCLSNLIVTFDDIEIKPLEAAFGYEKGTHQNVQIYGGVTQTHCAEFADNANYIKNILPLLPDILKEEWTSELPKTIPYKFELPNEQVEHLEKIKVISSRVAITMAVFLLVVLIGVMIYVWRLHKRYQRKQFEEEARFFKSRKSLSSPKVTFLDNNDFYNSWHEVSPSPDLETEIPINLFFPADPNNEKTRLTNIELQGCATYQ
ncbi:axotactin-like isoform X3 [Centruroides vittatus]|uniref:axotactin-like isoform X3 n=1 Tax=Centruroides vittatus TaxID=120091 RepID=UPI00350FD22A